MSLSFYHPSIIAFTGIGCFAWSFVLLWKFQISSDWVNPSESRYDSMAARRYAISTEPQQWEREKATGKTWKNDNSQANYRCCLWNCRKLSPKSSFKCQNFFEVFLPFLIFFFPIFLSIILLAPSRVSFSCFPHLTFYFIFHIPNPSTHLIWTRSARRENCSPSLSKANRTLAFSYARWCTRTVNFPSHEISFTRRQPKSGGVVVAAEKAKKGNSIWARVMSNAEKLKNKFVVSRTAHRSQVPTLYINKMFNGNRLKFPVRFIQSRSTHNVSTARSTLSHAKEFSSTSSSTGVSSFVH